MHKRETTHQGRIEIVDMHLAGMPLKQIAQQKRLNYYTVRHWWRAYRDGGWDGLIPGTPQRPSEGPLSTFDPLVRYVALRLKQEHPNWGPDLLLFKMGQRNSLAGKELPGRSALANYIKPYLPRIKKVQRRATLRRPKQSKVKPKAVHEVWQMDFKGAEVVGECGKVVPFMVVEVVTSAPLRTTLYAGSLKGVTWRDVQRELRKVFAEWGLPDFIQMDRDAIFVGSTRLEWPSGLLLWLVGIGVMPIINDARRPMQNAQVERQNRTWLDHVAIGANHDTVPEAQRATDIARQERLYHLPSRNRACQGHPPLIACPQLQTPRRPFDPATETDLFDFERVELYLSDWRWRRTVDKTGCLSLADHNIRVGKDYQQHSVEIVFDLEIHRFVVRACNETRTTLRHFDLPVVTPAYIMGLGEANVDPGG